MVQKTPKDLYELIDGIYNQFNFSKNLMIHNFMIISQDNYYVCQYSDDFISIQIRTEIHHHIMSKPTYELTINKEFKEVAFFPILRVEHDRPVPNETIQELIPIFRQFQLDKLLENGSNN